METFKGLYYCSFTEKSRNTGGGKEEGIQVIT